MIEVSRVDQKIAARIGIRQVETLIRMDAIGKKTDADFNRALKQLLAVVQGDSSYGLKISSFSEAMQQAIRQAKATVAESFRLLIEMSHHSAVDVLFSSLPRKILIARVPLDSQFESTQEQRRGKIISGYGSMYLIYEDQDPFGIPSGLAKRELTDEEKEDVARQIIFPPPTQKEVADIVSRGDWNQRFDRLSSLISDKKLAFNEIVQGYSDGENISQLRKRLEPLVDGVKSSAQRIARTEGMRIAERIQRRAWEPISDMMTGVQIIAVLDERTRPEHATRNGDIYYKDPKGAQKSINELPDLPDQPNCRCMSSPILEPPQELRDDPEVREAFKIKRKAGAFDSMTYDSWFKKTDPGRRKLVVGVTRYNDVRERLGEARDPEWSDFIGIDGSLLTLAQIQNETAVERQSRKEQIAKEMSRRGKARRSNSARGFEWPRG